MNFVQLRGAPKRGPMEGVSVWESTKGVQEFSNCAVYRAEELGDYVMCVQTTECAKGKDSFHAMSAAFMSCLKNWNWQDGQVGRDFRDEQQRMVTATNDDGLRITFELARAKNSWPKCDLSLSIEVVDY